METSDSMARRLAQIRKALKLKQIDVAKSLAVDRSIISKIETGKLEVPTSLLLFYNAGHGVSGEWLLSGQEPVFKAETPL